MLWQKEMQVWGALCLGTLVVVLNPGLSLRRWRFFTAPGMTFNSSDASNTFNVSYPCECKALCLINQTCLAWTAEMRAEAWSCLHATKGPLLTPSLTNNSAAVYGFTEDTLTGVINVVQKEDQLHYFVPNMRVTTTQAGRGNCSKIPGFRLAMLKTEQQQSIGKALAAQAGSALRMDIVVIANKTYWGDGTPYSGQVIGVALTNMTLIISNLGITSSMLWPAPYFLCQGNHVDLIE
nr:uncharacterized protein LOC123760365 [Procambarus clarkii]